MRVLCGLMLLATAGCYQSWQPGGSSSSGGSERPSVAGWLDVGTGGSPSTGGLPSTGGMVGGGWATTGGTVPLSGGTSRPTSGGMTPIDMVSGGTTGGSVPPPAGGRPGSDILNPQGCATPRPFELSIDPSTGSGSVRGWLESTAQVSFVDGLPQFSRPSPGNDNLSLWWSIASAESQTVYFYGGGFGGETMDLTAMVAIGATSFAEVDLDRLAPPAWASDAVTVGEVVVVHDERTGVYLGIRVDDVYLTDAEAGESCSGLDASWTYLN